MMSAARQQQRVTLNHLLPGMSLADGDVAIDGVALDSRSVTPGDLFLAVAGEVHDGRQFIEQAVANGANAVVAEAPVSGFVDDVSVPLVELPELHLEVGLIAARFFAHPSESLPVIGVTGTNGKTTTTCLLAQMMRLLGRQAGVIGTLGVSLDGTVQSAINTTPDPVSLQGQFAAWREKGVDIVGMEVSSHALVQGRVNGVCFDTAVFTNLSQDHLDYHGTMESYGKAKLRLFNVQGLKHAVVNLDDAFSEQVLASIPGEVNVVTYSVVQDSGADVFFSDVHFHDEGVAATLHTPWGDGACASPLRGAFNLSNLAASISALLVSGISLEEVSSVIPRLQPVAGRMETVPNTIGLQVVVDYAHTPDALKQALSALRPHVENRIFTVFGCGGDRDRSKRAVMGRLACDLSDRVYVTSDNPRSEPALAIIADIETGCQGDYQMIVDRAQAIDTALSEAQAGDCVLIAGKGHEDYQLIDGERLHFSDREQAQKALLRRAGQ